MNEKFFELPIEKQRSIINAGFKVFSQNDYKRSSTEDIASYAGISKGLLFYYFHNKKTLYMFLYEYATKLITENIVESNFEDITDFFELIQYAGARKVQLLKESPFIAEFIVKCFYSQKEDVSEELNNKIVDVTDMLYKQYFTNIDLTKFKDDVNPKDILQMLSWMADGYLHELNRKNSPVDYDEFNKEYKIWCSMLKKVSYKEDL
jgi:TetR/AcrR family transcriptional regulator